MTTRDNYLTLDAGGPLTDLRQLFALPDDVIYLDSNSLGAHPRAAVKRTAEVVAAEWGEGLTRSWNSADWCGLSECPGDKLVLLIDARVDEVMITGTTLINLPKVFSAAPRIRGEGMPGRKVIVSESSNFPTDLCIAGGFANMLQRGYRLRLVDSPEQLPTAIDADTAAMMLSHVNYKTGYLYDTREVTRLVHESGALTAWGLAHSIGALPLDLHATEVGYAIGCTYKYLNGGPGSSVYVWAASRLRERIWQPPSGWFGRPCQFATEPRYQPDEGITRLLCGTQPIISLALAECGLDIFAWTDMQRLRDESLALAGLFIELVESRCKRFGLTLVTPCEHARRGSHVSPEHVQGYAIVQVLIDREVIGDYREPGILRFGSTPPYTHSVEVWDAMQALLEILQSEA